MCLESEWQLNLSHCAVGLLEKPHLRVAFQKCDLDRLTAYGGDDDISGVASLGEVKLLVLVLITAALAAAVWGGVAGRAVGGAAH